MNFKPEFEKKNPHDPHYESIEKYMTPIHNMVTLHPDQDIMEAIAIILDKRISGAPVLDEHRHLVGNLSEKDCLKVITDMASQETTLDSKKVKDYMSVKVSTFTPGTTVVDAAIEFLSTSIRRYAVVREGELIGQISRREILAASLKIKSTTW